MLLAALCCCICCTQCARLAPLGLTARPAQSTPGALGVRLGLVVRQRPSRPVVPTRFLLQVLPSQLPTAPVHQVSACGADRASVYLAMFGLSEEQQSQQTTCMSPVKNCDHIYACCCAASRQWRSRV